VVVGLGAEEMSLPIQYIGNNEITLTGTFRYANTWPTAIALAVSGRVELDTMVTGRFPLEQTKAALDGDEDE
jgi:L-iditol 2-dehydrogenase